MSQAPDQNRRRLLGFLAASPLMLLAAQNAWALKKLIEAGAPRAGAEAGLFEMLPDGEEGVARLEDMLNLMDFEDVARRTLPPAHFGFLATGVDDDATVRANHEGYSRYALRSRRMVDTRKISTSIKLFGTEWTSPIFLSPVSSQKAFNPEGEVAVARGARAGGHLQMLSTLSSTSLEKVTEARGGPVWQQLYPTDDWNVGRAIIKRAEAAGSPVLVLTVDLKEGSNRETLFRARRKDSRTCVTCHTGGFEGNISFRKKPMLQGVDLTNVHQMFAPDLSWEYVKRIRDITPMKLVLKGIVTREDAQLALDNGVDGIVVSNHGGRAEDTYRSTIECLPEVAGQVAGKIPVMIDGGIRRGTDVLKALALGATAVGIGRPYVWGLASFGQAGVEKVLEILQRELVTIMRQTGVTSLDSPPASLVTGRN